MQKLEQLFFSPLGKEYCRYFYYLTILTFLFFAVAVVGGTWAILKRKASLVPTLLSLIGPFLVYFTNRLLYSMCAR